MNISDFNRFSLTLKKVLEDGTTYLNERNELSPFKISDRLIARAKEENPRIGSVLVLFYLKKDVLSIPLILRPTYDGVHSGQVAFPGGEEEESDVNTIGTALREAEEELGIISEDVQILGKLSDIYIPPSRFLVTPVVGMTVESPRFIPDKREVQKIIEMPASMLFDDSIIKSGIVSTNQGKLEVPYFDVEGHVVWGATAIMLSELKANLKRVEKLLI